MPRATQSRKRLVLDKHPSIVARGRQAVETQPVALVAQQPCAAQNGSDQPNSCPASGQNMGSNWYFIASTGSTPARIWPVIIPGSATKPVAAMALMVGIIPARMALHTHPFKAVWMGTPVSKWTSMAGLFGPVKPSGAPGQD